MVQIIPSGKLAWLFVALEACFAALLCVYNWNANLPLFLAIYLTACGIFFAVVVLLRRGSLDAIPNVSGWILAGGILLRLTIFWCPPTISQDIYRYVWDGRVQNAGFGPYDYPPGAEELKALRNQDYPKINHKEFNTPYPPAAQLLFRFLALFSASHVLVKSVILGFDILLLFLLKKLITAEQLEPAVLLIYAWHPLVVIEFAGSGHMDVMAISLMFLGFLLLAQGRNILTGITLAIAVLMKYLPAVTLPWLWRRGRWAFALSFVITIIILFIPYYTTDLRIFGGLSTFYEKWWFNDSLFGLLRVLFGESEPARLTGAAFVAAAAALAYWKQYPVYRSFFLINAAIILFAPVVHPWYVLWIVPFLVFHFSRAWLFFSCWVAMSYLILYIDSGQIVWQKPIWLQLLVYVPFYSLLLVDFVRGRRKVMAPGSGGPRL